MDLNVLCKRFMPALLIILLAGIIVYANTFQVPFVMDDHIWITQSDVIKDLHNFSNIFAAYEFSIFSRSRFVGGLTFALNYYFSGFNVAGYHAVNLLIHLLTGLLVYVVIRLTLRTPYFLDQFENQGSDPQQPTLLSPFHSPHCVIPLFAALLFVVHPVQTQAVTYIVQRMTSLTTFFYLFSLVLYVQARLSMEEDVSTGLGPVKMSISRNSTKILLCYIGSVLSAILAMHTKEISFTLPFSVGLYELFFFKGPWKRRLLYLLPILATLPIVPMSRMTIGESTGDLLVDMEAKSRAHTPISRWDYLLTQFRVIVTYLRLLVLPVNQNLDYNFQIYHTFFTPPVFLSFLILSGLVLLSIRLYFSTSKLKSHSSSVQIDPAGRLIAFGILWFFLALSVESSFIPIVDVIVEHRVYLPSIGATLAFSTAFYLAGKKKPRSGSNLLILGGLIIILGLSVATYQRNNVWKNEIDLWEDVLSKSPGKVRPLNNLGLALIKAERPWEAIPVLSQALKKAPDYYNALFNLGRAYMEIGQSRKAIPYLQRAIENKQDFDLAYLGLGLALMEEKRFGEAISILEQNLGRGSLREWPVVYLKLGEAYYYSGNPAAARRQLEILSRMDPVMASKLVDLLQ